MYHRTFELSKYPIQIDQHDIKKQLGSVFLTKTHLIDVKENHEDYSVPLQQVKEIHLFERNSLGKELGKIIVALIFIIGPLATIAYMLWYINDFWKKLFQPDYLFIWLILLPALTILAFGISLFLDFTNTKKYIKVELRTDNTRRMLYFNRKHISEQEVDSLLQDIKAAINELQTSGGK